MVMDYVSVDGVQYEINRADTFKLSSQMDRIEFEPEVLNYSMNDPYISVAMEGYDTRETVCLLSELDKFSYSQLKSQGINNKCPELEIGKNSANPCTNPNTIASEKVNLISPLY